MKSKLSTFLFAFVFGYIVNSSSGQQNIGCRTGWIENPTTGSCFLLVKEQMDWENARQKCENLGFGSQLAIIRNGQDNKFVKDYLAADSLEGGGVWMGATDYYNAGNWVWTDGSEVSCFTDWYEGEPYGLWNGKPEDCLAWWKSWNYQWNDESCKTKIPAMCMIPAQRCENGWTINPASGTCYKILEDKLPWGRARVICAQLNSELTSIRTIQENKFLQELLNPSDEDSFWLGGNVASDGYWVWDSLKADRKSPISLAAYSNWSSGQPTFTENKKCLKVRKSNMEWISENCDMKLSPICKKHYSKSIGLNNVTLNNYFSNEMVLQRGVQNIIWGYGTSKTHFEYSCITMDERKIEGQLTPIQISENVWQVKTPIQDEWTLCNFKFSENTKLENVVYGDVWLCSGQSNMEQNMENIFNSSNEIKNAEEYYNYTVRFATVANKFLNSPQPNLNQEMKLSWSMTTTPNAIKEMSAVCFLYGRTIYNKIKVPQGMVNSDWGGTRIEAWSSPDALKSCNISSNSKGNQNANSVLWNGMINPILRVSVRGFLWYQGEANMDYNRDLYSCTFPAMIRDWRSKFSQVSEGTNKNAPFGFVQLSTWRWNSDYNGFPVIRWHQTADVGYVPNAKMLNVFMSSPLDTYDPKSGYPGGIHPRDKQIVAERLAFAGLNTAYGLKEYPTNGPYPNKFTLNLPIVTFEFDKDLEYLIDAEISGFYFCSESIDDCDKGTTVEKWKEVTKEKVKQDGNKTIIVDLSDFDTMSGGSIAYIWRETPVKDLYKLPIYSSDLFRMPTPPFKFYIEDNVKKACPLTRQINVIVTCDDGTTPQILPATMIKCSASSTYDTRYTCSKALQGPYQRGDNGRAWATKGQGVGAWIHLEFNIPIVVKMVRLLQRYYSHENARRIRFEYVDDNSYEEAFLSNFGSFEWNDISLKRVTPIKSLRIKVMEMVPYGGPTYVGFKGIQIIGCPNL